eukprot:TRINITY_DN4431_c0_g1_i2.p1 TRINITY_DN4431_c0_g1~~TRINITY_DN4431_c0_g1_i2.p1  ORF type:complete len:501 (+),score=223.69 TRINITY_DN4431_c0_g1_i2:66-1568(+)
MAVGAQQRGVRHTRRVMGAAEAHRRRQWEAEVQWARGQRQEALQAGNYAQAELLALRIAELQRNPSSAASSPLSRLSSAAASPASKAAASPCRSSSSRSRTVGEESSRSSSPADSPRDAASSRREPTPSVSASSPTAQATSPQSAASPRSPEVDDADRRAALAKANQDLAQELAQLRAVAAELASRRPSVAAPPTEELTVEARLAAVDRHTELLQRENRAMRRKLASAEVGGRAARMRATIRELDEEVVRLQRELATRRSQQSAMNRQLRRADRMAEARRGDGNERDQLAMHCAAECEMLQLLIDREREQRQLHDATLERQRGALDGLREALASQQPDQAPRRRSTSDGADVSPPREIERQIADFDRRASMLRRELVANPQRRQRRAEQLQRDMTGRRALVRLLEKELSGARAELARRESLAAKLTAIEGQRRMQRQRAKPLPPVPPAGRQSAPAPRRPLRLQRPPAAAKRPRPPVHARAAAVPPEVRAAAVPLPDSDSQ